MLVRGSAGLLPFLVSTGATVAALPCRPVQTLMDVILGRKTVGLIRGDILVRGWSASQCLLAVLATTLRLSHGMHAAGRPITRSPASLSIEQLVWAPGVCR